MNWNGILALGVTLRPYDDPPASGGIGSPFEAGLGATVELLRRELEMLDAERIVLQVGYRDHDLRLDGMPRANAQMQHDAVALSFQSKWGPLRYETNEFVARFYRSGGDGWQANLRAIALAMEALRKVDRYGVSKRGQQYTGWRAIPTKTGQPEDLIQTRDDALRFLDEHGGSFKAAASTLHPDKGGSADLFRAAVKAREILGPDA